MYRIIGLSVVSLLSFLSECPAAEQITGGDFVNRVYRDEHGEHKYVVFVPKGYSTEKAWPAIVWLHGASARGKDGRAPLVAGIGPNIARRRETFPFVVIFPQCEYLQSRLLGGWTDETEDADRALKILQAVEQDYRIDPQRRVLAGVSMGAFGVWAVAARTAELWSALIPVSGGGPISLAENMKEIPVWAFHAADDQVVPPSASQDLVHAVDYAGGRSYYTELPNGGHNIGSRVFAKDEVYNWLLDPSRSPQMPTDWPMEIAAELQLQNEVAFVPGAEVENSVRVHIGMDILEALAHTLPSQVPADALHGARGQQSEIKSSRWTRFQVTVPGVQYSGQLRAARLQMLPDNQIQIQLGLQPLTMTVLGTDIQGRWLRAQAGAMQVVIGSQQPAWLNVVVRPRIEARRLKLDLVSAEFPIAAGNWYVTEPQGINVQPLPFLRDRISRQITDGIYAKQGEISQQVVASVPRMLELIEQRVQTQLDRTVTFGRWPMPVWQPRAKFWLSGVTADSHGLTVNLGTTLAALAPQTDTVPLKQHLGPANQPPQALDGVQIAIAKDLVTAWTELLAASEVRRFHVQDFHAKEFHRLADPELLAQVIPDWDRRDAGSEFRSVLSFEQPMDVASLETATASDRSNFSTMRLTGRELRLTISERTSPEAIWSPVAEFPLTWSQDFRITTRQVGHRGRRVQISSLAPPDVKSSGRLINPGTSASRDLKHALIAEQFRRGWESTFSTALAKEIRLPERMIADVPFVCDSCGLDGDYFLIQLMKPTTQIRNISREPLTYEIQLPGTGWSEPHVLLPGKLHEFSAPAPITWRSRSTGRELRFTLPIGSVSRYHGGDEQPLTLDADEPPTPLAGWSETIMR